MSRVFRWFRAADAPGLWALLGFALLMRLPAVFFSRGYAFMDEQFQYVEPAWSLRQGLPYTMTHEWVRGIRSWVYPWLLSQVMALNSLLGLDDPQVEMGVIRFVHAVCSLLMVVGLRDLIVGRLKLPASRPVLLLLSANGMAVYLGVHPNAPALATTLVVFAVCEFLHGGRWRALLAGLALGLAFCCRAQDGVFGLPLFVAGLCARRWRETALLTLAALVMVAVQGFVDLATWGSFLHSTIEYVKYNAVEGNSSNWGEEPWFVYPLLVVAISPLLHSGLGYLLRGARLLPAVAGCALLSLAMHQTIAHRAPRFVTTALSLVLLLWAVGLSLQPPGRWRTWSVWAAALLHVVGWFAASFSYQYKANIEAAVHLAAQADNRGVVYYHLIDDATSGSFYYRNPAPRRVYPRWGEAPDPDQLVARALAENPPPTFLVTRRDREPRLPPGWRMVDPVQFDPFLLPRDSRSLRVWRLTRQE
jgi:hypothetical protein